MARLRLKEIQEAHGLTDQQMAEIFWPETKPHTRWVQFARWKKQGIVTVRLDQLQNFHDRFPNEELIDYGTRT